MPSQLRRILLIGGLILVVAAGPLAFFDYVLPHHAVVRVVGTEIKRVDTGKGPVKGEPTGQTKDVFYIYTEDADSKKPHVFRNEDTGWGFPWYFKFNSADVQATAQSIAGEHGTAVVTYYGWRIPLFSLMPNAIKIVRAAPDAWPIPWFNIIFFTVLIGGIAWIAYQVRNFWARRQAKRR
jgi:hypothetical protein